MTTAYLGYKSLPLVMKVPFLEQLSLERIHAKSQAIPINYSYFSSVFNLAHYTPSIMNRWHGPGRPPGSALGPYKAGQRGSSLLCPGREGCTVGNRTLQQGKNRPMVPQAPEQRSRSDNRPPVYLTLGQRGCEHQEAEPIRHSSAGKLHFL